MPSMSRKLADVLKRDTRFSVKNRMIASLIIQQYIEYIE